VRTFSRPFAVALAASLGALPWLGVPLPASAAVPPLASTVAVRHSRLQSVHIMGRHRRHAGSKQQSLNWSGYIRTGQSFTRVTGSWLQPAVSSTHDGYSSTWVGIDGATSGDGYLIQTGTEADVSGGRRSYRAWWEVITPTEVAPETVFPTLVIHPGDSVSASVSRTTSGRWTMRVRDNTTGHSASHTVDFAGPGSSAEWIEEDTDVNGYISTAPDWGSVTFRRLTLNGASPRLQPSEAVDIVDTQGTREASTSDPTPSGSGFTVTWLAPGTRTAAG
jgi:hypothetical protein